MGPILYQINTRLLLSELGSGATLDTVPDNYIDRLAQAGFDWVWLLGVWTIGSASAEVSRTRAEWVAEYRGALPDVGPEDICGSPFAIKDYSVDPSLGGDAALSRFRARLAVRGIKLLLDFVPNHVALDHSWATTRSDFLIEGSREDLTSKPDCWHLHATGRVFAFGRDPNFAGWPDTLQLNYFNPELRNAMRRELSRISYMCDGVRCDMTMLLEPEIFSKTWAGRGGEHPPYTQSFWPAAAEEARRCNPTFLFIAEVYWGYEARILGHGFDYAYDKTLYDHLVQTQAGPVLGHLSAPLTYQNRLVRFLENHDEPRIASKLPLASHKAAATVALLSPGMHLLHAGQLQGYKTRMPIHLRRAPHEEVDVCVERMYDSLIRLMRSPVVRKGEWRLLYATEAWGGDTSYGNFICYLITGHCEAVLTAVNLSPARSYCYLPIPRTVGLTDRVTLSDQLSTICYERSGRELHERGLFLDVEPFTSHAFLFPINER